MNSTSPFNILFFDTETTGIPADYKAPTSEPDKWPHMVQLAMLLSDIEGKKLASHSFIIRPEGYTIPEEVTKIHGITTERALAEGVLLSYALGVMAGLQSAAVYLAGHNTNFDGKIVRAACSRVGLDPWLTKAPTICTMMESTQYCNLPGPRGKKWPKLTELHEKLFGHPHDNAHDAMGDVLATHACFFELMKRGIISPATFAKASDKHHEIQNAVEAKKQREAQPQTEESL